MIIKRLEVEHWRNLSRVELELVPGLNVLRGDNETGKSSLVEAIDKALHWNHAARKSKADRLEQIVPAHQPAARPTVTLELELHERAGRPPVTLVVTKVVAAESRNRACYLEVRRGAHREQLTGEDAEARLSELLSWRPESRGAFFSLQGDTLGWLEAGLPQKACAAVSVHAGGQVSVSPRLERVRQRVEQSRESELQRSLSGGLRKAARGGTEAAVLRDELERVEQHIVACRQLLDRVGDLRMTIQRLEQQLVQTGPSRHEAERILEERRERRKRQDEARVRLAQAQARGQQAELQRQQLDDQVAQLTQCRQQIARLEEEAQRTQQRVAELHQQRERLEALRQDARKGRDARQAVVDDLKLRQTACDLVRERTRLAARLEEATRHLEQLEQLRHAAEQADAALAELGRWPRGEEIGRWRKEYAKLDALQRDAANQLQLELELLAPAAVAWWADAQAQANVSVAAGSIQNFRAVRSLRLEIEGVGSIRVHCGAEELAELLAQIERRRRELDQQLAPLGITCRDLALPLGFDRLEERRIQGEAAARAREQARQQFSAAQRDWGDIDELRLLVATLGQELQAAEARLRPLAHLVLPTLDSEALDQQADKLRSDIRQREAEVQEATRTLDDLQGQLDKLLVELQQAQDAQTKARLAVKQCQERIQQLTADGLTDAQRDQQLRELRRQEVLAAEELAACQAACDALGAPVTDADIEPLRQRLKQLDEEHQANREALVRARTELQAIADKDPQGLLDELAERRAELSAKLEAHERRLAALVLLHELLQAERRRLSNLVAEPLNRRLRPWLTAIRGQTTSVVFDPDEGRITHLISQRGGRDVYLPFSEHSTGMKDQISFLLRLILAQDLARQYGTRQFVALDDPLVNSSPTRRPELFRILQQAAEHLQILFVTCHDDRLALLPPSTHVIEFDLGPR